MSERKQQALERPPEDSTIYTVYLDSGSFYWLIEILEAKTRAQTWLKPYQALVRRTLLSFDEARRAATADTPPLNGDAPVPRRRTIPRVMKKNTKSPKR